MRRPPCHANASSADPIDRSARELRGVLQDVRWRSPESGFTIGYLRSGESVKGVMAAPLVGVEYHLIGCWKLDPRYGWGFAFDDAQPLQPTTSEGVADYLRAHAPWVGRAVARAITEAFADGALEVLRTAPERVALEIKGITSERALEIQRVLCDREALERVEVEVRGLVAPAGVNGRQLRAILERYGREAAAVLRANPYRLIDDIEGVGWKTADAVGIAQGLDREAPGRVRAGILHALREAEGEGHTCVLRTALVRAAAAGGVLGVRDGIVSARVDELLARGERPDDGGPDLTAYTPAAGAGGGAAGEPLVYRRATYEDEAAVASVVLSLLSPAPRSRPAAAGGAGLAALDEVLAEVFGDGERRQHDRVDPKPVG